MCTKARHTPRDRDGMMDVNSSVNVLINKLGDTSAQKGTSIISARDKFVSVFSLGLLV